MTVRALATRHRHLDTLAGFAPALAAIALGAAILFVAGFAGSDILHAAAHDGRHAFAFPCH
jgi:cobalt transporter subunit CbtB